MNYFFILLAVSLTSFAQAQNDQGTIVYKRTMWYSKIINSLPYLTQEQKERQLLTWGKDDGWSSNYNLTFTPDVAVYTYGVDEKTYSYSWKKDEFLIIDDLTKRKQIRQFDFGGKLFKLEDEKPTSRWKIKNEIREVAGYLCMKAVTQDTIKDQTIVAWFTDQIPVCTGPEGYGGLPGLILMLDINDGTVIVEAKTVTWEVPEHPIPKKIKGKEIAFAELNAMMSKYINESIKGQRNPYWQMRY